MLKSEKKHINIMIDYMFIIIGTAFYSLGIHIFTSPNNIAPGGVTGISTLVNYLTGFPIGLAVNIINIPLFILAVKFLGKGFTIKTLISTLLFSFFVDFVYKFIPVYKGDLILAAIFGGLLLGTGLALVFMRDGSTGGTDITNRILQKKKPHIKLGHLVLTTDIIIISIAGFVYNNIENSLYSIIVIFVATKVLDVVLYGLDSGKMVMIVSGETEKVGRHVTSKLNRGGTILSGRGVYTDQKRDILLCAIRKNEFYKLKKMVHEVDPNAFLIVTDAGEVIGQGFKPISE